MDRMSSNGRQVTQLLSTDMKADKRTPGVRACRGRLPVSAQAMVRFGSVVNWRLTAPRNSHVIVVLACLLVGMVLGHAGHGAAELAPAPASASAAAATSTDVPTLLSRHVAEPPLVDGEVDGVWFKAVPLSVPLTWGRHAEEMALAVRLRSLYTDQAIYFLAQWPEAQPATEPGVMRNRLTLHFDLPAPTPDAAKHMCLVACHTAFADAAGSLAYLSAETIPPGRTSPLPAAGGWHAGVWQLEWSRPLLVDNHFDLQFEDLEQAYRFFVKVFQWQEGRADPVSKDCQLLFLP
jgi:hypothetical protein